MPRDKDLLILRNKKIKERFNELSKEHPEYKLNNLLDLLSVEFYISNRTVSAVLNNETVYRKFSY